MKEKTEEIATLFIADFPEWGTEPAMGQMKKDIEYILYFSKRPAKDFKKFIAWQIELLDAISIPHTVFFSLCKTILMVPSGLEKKAIGNIEAALEFEDHYIAIKNTDDLPEKNKKNHLSIPRSELSEVITNKHIELFQKIDPFSNQSFRKKIINDCDKHLEFLNQALDTDSKVLFTEYVGWTASTLDSLGIPSISLIRFLVSIRLVLKNSELAPGIDYIDDAIRSLISIGSINEHRSESYLTTSESKKYMTMILDGNRKNATNYIIELADNGMDLKDIYIEIFQKTQYEIGRLWKKNKVSVAQEHYCTATTQMIMSMLYPRLLNSKSIEKTVVATCVGSELHEIGIRMVADFLELEGWDTYYIGANTPTEAIIESVKNKSADLLAISVTLSPHVKKAIEIIRDVKQVLPGLKILVGGYPFIQDPQLCTKIGADGFVTSAQDVHNKAISLFNG